MKGIILIISISFLCACSSEETETDKKLKVFYKASFITKCSKATGDNAEMRKICEC